MEQSKQGELEWLIGQFRRGRETDHDLYLIYAEGEYDGYTKGRDDALEFILRAVLGGTQEHPKVALQLVHRWLRRWRFQNEEWLGFYRKQPIPAHLRRQVLVRDNYECQGCGSLDNLCIDHITPEVAGGPMELENLRVLCRTCNASKGPR